ncbi:hypothetical protein [Streptomyces yaizuensis]|uniref:Uncharacterized protein n=1 Tax=Streptomyces yaizuensis TaxID=2989713 RepID=A0ABQ5P008_9ACTN|nr:hypothetical protein [Streptomyces sp. YSPA8]GLF95937.1 hypothetical protein SYYSPA8_16590 [Streptomyces sp. YSPA8]
MGEIGANGVFEAATGDGPPTAGDAARTAEVQAAYAGLIQIRRLTGTAPAPWERGRMVWAVALALEAGGVPPSAVAGDGARVAAGYRVVADAERPDAVRVEWAGPPGGAAPREAEGRLREGARVLAEAGWEALLYRGAGGRRFLEVEPAG